MVATQCANPGDEHARNPAEYQYFAESVMPVVRALGREPDDTGSVAAAPHRGWIDLTSALGGGDYVILAASETGDDFAVDEYKKALNEIPPAPVRDIVERQFQSVMRAHDMVKGIRDRLEKLSGSASP